MKLLFIRRRELLWGLFGLLGWSNRTVTGSVAASDTEYLDLREPISFPRSKLTEIWESSNFEAWVQDRHGNDKLLKGMLLRISEPRKNESGLRAFCRYCPHEVCETSLVKDTKIIRLESGRIPTHPLIVCPCHFSTFNPLRNGINISGPAFRGLFRFRITIPDDRIYITQVEKAALTLFV